MRPHQARRGPRDSELIALVATRLLARYDDCPKCHGQYRRDGWTCHCYQCCFEWDLRDPEETVLARARRRYRGELPTEPFLAETPWDQQRRADGTGADG